MVLSSKTFRVFVSSTFSDLKEERNALQREVFPKLRELCMEHGFRFQAIDLRWGISEEAGLDQQTMKICFEEIERCQRVTPRPNFIILLGERYGWQPLPEEIQSREFKEILKHVTPKEEELLCWNEGQAEDRKGWYREDLNALPPVYVLQPRIGIYEDYDTWKEIEEELLSIIRKAVNQMDLNKDIRLRYFASATEQEIWKGIQNDDAEEHVFGFFRKIKKFHQIEDEFIEQDQESWEKIELLKDGLRDTIKCTDYSVDWTNEEEKEKYLQELCDDVYNSLLKIINEQINKYKETTYLNREITAHKRFEKEKSKHFTGRTEILKNIESYLDQRQEKPLAIYGVSGSGKTALMAYVAQKTKKENPEYEVISRYIGATAASSDIRSLMESLCEQISDIYDFDQDAPKEYQKLVDELPVRLSLASQEKQLIIFLDALDQLSDFENAHQLGWIPSYLPENVHLIVSTIPGECLEVLGKKLPSEKIIEVGVMEPEEGERLIDLWLDDASKKLQEHQKSEVLEKFKDNGLPLYLKLAFEEVARWKSYTNPQDTMLSSDIPDLIGDMFERLASEFNHGEVMVSKSLGYLTASRYGLSEDEIIDILSRDPEVFYDFMRRARSEPTEILENLKPTLKEELKDEDLFKKLQTEQEFTYDIFKHAQDKKIPLKIPLILWSRLYFDLEPYLTERQVQDLSLLTFYHRQLKDTVGKKYLTEAREKSFHSDLADYFNSQTLTDRKVDELPWQQDQAESWEMLKNSVTNLEMLKKLMNETKKYELMLYWHHIGNQYNMVDEYKKVLQKYEKETQEENLPGYYDTVVNLLQLNAYYDDAELLCRRALEIRERIFGPNDPTTASSLCNLGFLLHHKGDLEGAEPIFRQAMEITERVSGSNHLDMAIRLNNLAALLQDKGDFDESEHLFKQALKIRERILGPNHIYTVETLNNLALLLNDKGNNYEAELLLRKAIEITERVLGPNHPDKALSLNNLALILNSKGDYEDAEPLYRRALEIYQEVLGPEHPFTAICINNLALLLKNKGDYNDAETLYRQALEIFERILGYENHQTLKIRENLNILLKIKGKNPKDRKGK